MTDKERAELTARSNALRLELKIWEKDFASANHGQRASRNDIKMQPDIAAKYKEYNRTRDILSGKVRQEPPASNLQTHRKRRNDDETTQVISKRQQIHKTPSKTPMKPWDIDPYESPSLIRNLFTPSKKAIKPTPQKDGQVLGLFDLLQEGDGTPSKSGHEPTARTQAAIQATPRKSTGDASLKHSKTPESAGKHCTPEAFPTPLKNRIINDQGLKTPSSVSKLHFSTPSFLKRDIQRLQMPVVNENDEGVELSPQMVRVPRKPLVRGLSSILAGLRKMEEEAADEDLEALRDIENEMATGIEPTRPATVPTILVEGSQPQFPLGGFDDEAMLDSEPEELNNPSLGRDGQPLKVYKKKGQKRTTRRVIMKPTRSKPQAHPEVPVVEDSEDDVANAEEGVPDTQLNEMAGFGDARNFDSDSQSEYTASEGGTRYRRPDQSKKKRITKDGHIISAARKVNAMAHQNFKRLKLRNSGAKGGPAYGSRFRRKK